MITQINKTSDLDLILPLMQEFYATVKPDYGLVEYLKWLMEDLNLVRAFVVYGGERARPEAYLTAHLQWTFTRPELFLAQTFSLPGVRGQGPRGYLKLFEAAAIEWAKDYYCTRLTALVLPAAGKLIDHFDGWKVDCHKIVKEL